MVRTVEEEGRGVRRKWGRENVARRSVDRSFGSSNRVEGLTMKVTVGA